MTRTAANGQAQTKLKAQGQDAFHEAADQLFYMVGQDGFLAVPKQDMPGFLEEMCLLESVVEAQHNAVAELKRLQDRYIQIMQGSILNPDNKINIENADSAEALERKIRLAQSALDKANDDLRKEIEPVREV